MPESGTPASGEPGSVRTIATYRVSEKRAGLRLDLFLKECIPKLSRQGIQRAIQARVELPGRRARPKPSLVLREGDVVVLNERIEHEPPIPEELWPTVLHEDEDLIATAKPAGLGVHASRQTVRNHLIGWLRERYGDEVALAHRLDRETSGVILSTRNTPAARALAHDFRSGAVHKEYLAIVHGAPPEAFRSDEPIGDDKGSKIFIKQGASVLGASPAATGFVRERVLDEGRYSLVRAFPETGRRHQIRVHLAALGYPVVGDKLYSLGDRFFLRYVTWGMSEAMAEELGARRQLLHASVLEVRHPSTGTPLRLTAPLPADFQSFLGRVPASR